MRVMQLPEAHALSLDVTRGYVAGVVGDRWVARTPCDGWDVRELVNHVVAGNLWVPPLVQGMTIAEVGDRYDGDVLGDDPLGAYGASAGPAADAFCVPGALDAACAVSYGPVPGAIYCGHRFIDVLIHGWDLAVATGQDRALPADLVDACLDVVLPQAELLEGSGAFAARVDLPEDAPAQDRLLGLLGRQP